MSGGRRVANLRQRLADARRERLIIARAHAHMLDASGDTLPDLTNGEAEEAAAIARRIVAEADAASKEVGRG